MFQYRFTHLAFSIELFCIFKGSLAPSIGLFCRWQSSTQGFFMDIWGTLMDVWGSFTDIWNILQNPATPCNALQHTATHLQQRPFMDIWGTFMDVWGSFTDISRSFTDLIQGPHVWKIHTEFVIFDFRYFLYCRHQLCIHCCSLLQKSFVRLEIACRDILRSHTYKSFTSWILIFEFVTFDIFCTTLIICASRNRVSKYIKKSHI